MRVLILGITNISGTKRRCGRHQSWVDCDVSEVTGLEDKTWSHASGRYDQNIEEASTRLVMGAKNYVMRFGRQDCAGKLYFMRSFPPRYDRGLEAPRLGG